MIRIICLGKIKEAYLNDLINDYKKRISKYHKLEIIELKDINDLELEADNILKFVNNKDFIIGNYNFFIGFFGVFKCSFS